MSGTISRRAFRWSVKMSSHLGLSSHDGIFSIDGSRYADYEMRMRSYGTGRSAAVYIKGVLLLK